MIAQLSLLGNRHAPSSFHWGKGLEAATGRDNLTRERREQLPRDGQNLVAIHNYGRFPESGSEPREAVRVYPEEVERQRWARRAFVGAAESAKVTWEIPVQTLWPTGDSSLTMSSGSLAMGRASGSESRRHTMWIVTVVVLMAGGLLGAANLIAAKKPDARAMIEKLMPFQGWIGVVLFIWGIWDLISVLRSLSLLSVAPFRWLVFLITTLTELALGFLLGYGLISKYVLSGRAQALEKGQRLQGQLVKYQGPLGLTAIAIAILFALLSLTR